MAKFTLIYPLQLDWKSFCFAFVKAADLVAGDSYSCYRMDGQGKMHPPHVLLHIMCDYLRINYNSTVNLQQQHKGRQPSTNLRQGGKGVIGPI